MSRRSRKIEIHTGNEGSDFAIFGTDLGYIFDSIVDNESGVMVKRRTPDKAEFSHNIVHIHCIITCTDLIDYSITDETKVQLLRWLSQCFQSWNKGLFELLVSTWTIRALITYSSYRYWKNAPQSIDIGLKDTNGKKNRWTCRYHSISFDD